MPLRRKAVAPQTEYQVISERIERLENQVKSLRQPGPTTIQAGDYLQTGEPVPWETIINHPGDHVDAVPNAPIVYYHPGDTSPTGTVAAGFKMLGGVPGVEWTTTISGTDWGSDFTPLDFGAIVDPSNYDAVLPTFDVNANGNIEIFKSGIYILALGIAPTLQTNEMNKIKLRVDFISGETPEGMHSWTTPWYNDHVQHWGLAGQFNVSGSHWPSYWDLFSYSSNAFGVGTAGPGELEIAVYKEYDLVPIPDTAAVVRLLLVRLGGHWS